MSNSLEALARRAMACPKWRWIRGMQVVHTPQHDGATGFYLRLSQDGYVPAANEYVDFSDPVTVGCLLVLVREVWGQPTLSTRYSEYLSQDEWDVMPRVTKDRMTTYLPFVGSTEAEALVAALEAAP